MEKYLVFSPKVLEKLKEKHFVTEDEIYECFINMSNKTLKDKRARHKTDPDTLWFISETDKGRQLKICYVFYKESSKAHIKTAYEPNEYEIALYEEETQQ